MIGENSEVTLFLVDDDDVDVMTVKRALTKRRIANPVVRAKDGMQALEMLKSEKVPRPFVTLLDLSMPRMNGLEFLDEIRSDDILSDTVVFVLTTSRDKQDIDMSYERNIAGYFVKESAGDDFMKVADMLEGYWKIVCLPK